MAWNADVPPDLYQPLIVGELLNLPLPTSAFVVGVTWSLVVAALLAATGRAPRLLGVVVILLYFEWMVIAMSYGKVDHDRFAFLVALAVLPTVGAARWGDRARSEAAGWALRCVQVAVVGLLVGFHVVTYAGITIVFLPPVVAMLSMLPWERLRRDSAAPVAPAYASSPAPLAGAPPANA